MAKMDDVTGLRSEIRGSGPVGEGAQRNYLDPSLIPLKIDGQSEYRMTREGALSAAKFFGVVTGLAGAAIGTITRYAFSERFKNAPKLAAIGGGIGLVVGSLFGYHVGKKVVKEHIRAARNAIDHGEVPLDILPGQSMLEPKPPLVDPVAQSEKLPVGMTTTTIKEPAAAVPSVSADAMLTDSPTPTTTVSAALDHAHLAAHAPEQITHPER